MTTQSTRNPRWRTGIRRTTWFLLGLIIAAIHVIALGRAPVATGPSGSAESSSAAESLGAAGSSSAAGSPSAAGSSRAARPLADIRPVDTSLVDTSAVDTSLVDTSAAARTVQVLVGSRAETTLNSLPANFEAVLGYRPQLQLGYPVNPSGDCSSPIPLPQRFEPACRTHDFGYDLLRYAERTGHPLGPWARLAVDRMLISRMRATCHDPACLAAAELARAGLAVNTWRQHSGPPAPESAATIVASTALRVVSALGNGAR